MKLFYKKVYKITHSKQKEKSKKKVQNPTKRRNCQGPKPDISPFI